MGKAFLANWFNNGESIFSQPISFQRLRYCLLTKLIMYPTTSDYARKQLPTKKREREKVNPNLHHLRCSAVFHAASLCTLDTQRDLTLTSSPAPSSLAHSRPWRPLQLPGAFPSMGSVDSRWSEMRKRVSESGWASESADLLCLRLGLLVVHRDDACGFELLPSRTNSKPTASTRGLDSGSGRHGVGGPRLRMLALSPTWACRVRSESHQDGSVEMTAGGGEGLASFSFSFLFCFFLF